MPRNLYCNVLGSSPNVQNLVSKIFAKHLVSKVSCLVSVSERSSLGLVSSFCSKSWCRLGLATSMSRLGLEDFGRDSSSVLNRATTAGTGNCNKRSGLCIFYLDPDLATESATSLPCTPARPGIQAILTWFCSPK